MALRQIDIKFNSFKYVIDDKGLRVTYRKGLSVTRDFIPFEDIGSEIVKEKPGIMNRILGMCWLFVCIICLIISVTNRDVSALVIGVVLYVIYAWSWRNSLFLVQGYSNRIEFTGMLIYRWWVNRFIKILLKKRAEYLEAAYPPFEGLELVENMACVRGGIGLNDGLFLKQLTGRPIEGYSFDEYDGGDKRAGGIRSMTGKKNAINIIHTHQSRAMSEGKLFYIGDAVSGDDECGLCLTSKTNDPYKVMKFTKTNGVNYDIVTKDIIAKYKKWDKEFGIRIIAIGMDFCECEIINRDIDYTKLAKEVFEFCPDVVEQGTETVERLEEAMRVEGTIFLWWD